MDILFLIGRILFGGVLFMMGMNHFMKAGMMTQYAASKGVPSAKVAVMVSGALIIFASLAVILGVYTQLATIVFVVFFLVVSFKMHDFWTIQDPQEKMAQMVNFLKNMALMGAALMTLAIPTPWALSLF